MRVAGVPEWQKCAFGVAEGPVERGMPPRVFCCKSLELLENKGDGVLKVAKEFGIV